VAAEVVNSIVTMTTKAMDSLLTIAARPKVCPLLTPPLLALLEQLTLTPCVSYSLNFPSCRAPNSATTLTLLCDRWWL
jgi:hypothetical protein